MSKYNVVMGRTPIKMWTKGVPIEDDAITQLKLLSEMPFIYKHVAVMPDCHVGIGATIGTVLATTNAIIPSAVGVDIGCVDSETEYLSPEGWRYISEYDGGLVMQYSPQSGIGSFVTPHNYIQNDCDEFISIKTKYGLDQLLSPDHKMLIYKITGRKRERIPMNMLALDFESEHNRLVQGIKAEIETTFTPKIFSSMELSDEELRVQVMVHADCHLDKKKAVLRIKKERKILRAKKILTLANISYTEHINEGVTSIRFTPPLLTKVYDKMWWKANHKQLKIISEEALFWDGNHRDRCFFTRSKMCADFMNYAFTSCGYRSVMRGDVDKDGKIDYRVYQFTNTKIGIASSPKTPITRVKSNDGKSYCFTVESGYWVMRRNGNIAMTGNCGMNAVKTTLTANDLPDNLHALRTAIESKIPHGRSDNGKIGQDIGSWKDELEMPLSHRKVWNKMKYAYADIIAKHPGAKAHNTFAQLGTLGTGNHFIEVCLDESDNVWMMLHSGSRGLGNKIGQYFIEQAKEEMAKYYITEYLPHKDLAYLVEYTELFEDYVNAVYFAQDFAHENRKLMMEVALTELYNHVKIEQPKKHDMIISCHHNYVEKEHHFGKNVFVTRKGAVRARETDYGIIPGSMGTGSFIVKGKGDKESFCSCSHGAGRKMSRGKAIENISLQEHAEAMKGIEARLDIGVIDESPAAYKNINDVMSAQDSLVDIVFRLRQILNIKG